MARGLLILNNYNGAYKMKLDKYFYFLPVLFLLFVMACDKAHTVEYYDAHPQERVAKIEQCKKMNPVDLQTNRDCQAANRSFSNADSKRFFGTDKKRENPLDKPSKGSGFVDFK
jgi:hypothetical protein